MRMHPTKVHPQGALSQSTVPVSPYVGMIQIRSQVRAMQPTLSPLCADSLFTIKSIPQLCGGCKGGKAYSPSAVRILSSTFRLSSTKACLVRPAETLAQYTFSRSKKSSATGPAAARVSQKKWVPGRVSHCSSAAESNPGPMEVLNSTLPAPSCANSSLPSSRTFLFRQVNTTSLSASSCASGV